MLRTLTDLRGILFLYTHENPTANVDPTQIDQIYNKTKSEATRLVQQEKSITAKNQSQIAYKLYDLYDIGYIISVICVQIWP